MRPRMWSPPAEPSPAELRVIKAVRRGEAARLGRPGACPVRE
jgi:hypothetical protein